MFSHRFYGITSIMPELTENTGFYDSFCEQPHLDFSECWAELLHQKCEQAEREAKVSTVSVRLSKVAEKFTCISPPGIGLHEYVARIRKHAWCSNEAYILASGYLDMAVRIDPSLNSNYKNIHRLVIVSLLVAMKFQDDEYNSNQHMAVVSYLNDVTVMFSCRLLLFCN